MKLSLPQGPREGTVPYIWWIVGSDALIGSC